MPVLFVLLFSSLLNAAYFMPIVYNAFFCRPDESQFESGIREAPPFCVVPLAVTALISVILLFYPQPFFDLASMAVQAFTGA